MSKQQITWLLIRVAGVYFAYCAVLAIVPLGASVPDLFTLPKIDKRAQMPFDASRPMPELGQPAPTPEVSKEQMEAEKEFKVQALKNFLWFLGAFLFYAGASWYFIRDGRVIFDALNREEPFGIAQEKEEVMALNLSGEKESAPSENNQQ